MSLRKRIAVLMTIIVSSLMLVSTAFAGSWTLTTDTGSYTGYCSDSSAVLNCHGQLSSGSAPTETVVIQSGSCTLVLTPSGRANMVCK